MVDSRLAETAEGALHLGAVKKVKTHVDFDGQNPTARAIKKEIDASGGAIPYSTFMRISLYGADGYYSKAKVRIGDEGKGFDFETSPENSEYFGAGLGLAAQKVWEAMGKPEKFQIVEMGAGQGAQALSTLKWMREFYPDFYETIDYTIVEYGDLVYRQRDKLKEFSDKVNFVKGSAFELPLGNIEGMLVSNELPDTFPVEVIGVFGGKVLQKYVGLQDGQWVELWRQPDAGILDYLKKYTVKGHDGAEIQINLNAVKFQREVDRALKRGAVLTVDYGATETVGRHNVMRFYKARKFDDGVIESWGFPAYEDVGNVDITSDVDFGALGAVAEEDGLELAYMGAQSRFFQKKINAALGLAIAKKYGDGFWGGQKGDGQLPPEQMRQFLASKFSLANNFYVQMLVKGLKSIDIAWIDEVDRARALENPAVIEGFCKKRWVLPEIAENLGVKVEK